MRERGGGERGRVGLFHMRLFVLLCIMWVSIALLACRLRKRKRRGRRREGWRAVLIPTRLFGLVCCVWLGIARLGGESDGVVAASHFLDVVVVIVVAEERGHRARTRGG